MNEPLESQIVLLKGQLDGAWMRIRALEEIVIDLKIEFTRLKSLDEKRRVIQPVS